VRSGACDFRQITAVFAAFAFPHSRSTALERSRVNRAALEDALLPEGSRILVPVDFSQFSQDALQTALRLVGSRRDVTIELVHVVDDKLRDRDQWKCRAWFELEMMLAGVRTAAGHRRRVLVGPPAETLSAACREGDYALVVMPSHGMTGCARVKLGSVASHLSQESSVPVVLVKCRRHALSETALSFSSLAA